MEQKIATGASANSLFNDSNASRLEVTFHYAGDIGIRVPGQDLLSLKIVQKEEGGYVLQRPFSKGLENSYSLPAVIEGLRFDLVSERGNHVLKLSIPKEMKDVYLRKNITDETSIEADNFIIHQGEVQQHRVAKAHQSDEQLKMYVAYNERTYLMGGTAGLETFKANFIKKQGKITAQKALDAITKAIVERLMMEGCTQDTLIKDFPQAFNGKEGKDELNFGKDAKKLQLFLREGLIAKLRQDQSYLSTRLSTIASGSIKHELLMQWSNFLVEATQTLKESKIYDMRLPKEDYERYAKEAYVTVLTLLASQDCFEKEAITSAVTMVSLRNLATAFSTGLRKAENIKDEQQKSQKIQALEQKTLTEIELIKGCLRKFIDLTHQDKEKFEREFEEKALAFKRLSGLEKGLGRCNVYILNSATISHEVVRLKRKERTVIHTVLENGLLQEPEEKRHGSLTKQGSLKRFQKVTGKGSDLTPWSVLGGTKILFPFDDSHIAMLNVTDESAEWFLLDQEMAILKGYHAFFDHLTKSPEHAAVPTVKSVKTSFVDLLLKQRTSPPQETKHQMEPVSSYEERTEEVKVILPRVEVQRAEMQTVARPKADIPRTESPNRVQDQIKFFQSGKEQVREEPLLKPKPTTARRSFDWSTVHPAEPKSDRVRKMVQLFEAGEGSAFRQH